MHYYHELLLNAYAYSYSKPSYLFILIIAVYDYLVSHFGSDQDDQRKPDLLSYDWQMEKSPFFSSHGSSNCPNFDDFGIALHSRTKSLIFQMTGREICQL